LKRKYESLIGRRGKKKALVAVGHKIIVAAFHIIKNMEPYKEPVLHSKAKTERKQIRNYINKLSALAESNEEFNNLIDNLKVGFLLSSKKARK